METIALPPPQTEGTCAVERALQRRRSVRAFGPQALAMGVLGQLLWAAQGLTGTRGLGRTAPSAGARYPLEVYVVAGRVNGLPVGIYHYQPLRHALAPIDQNDQRAALACSALGQSWIAEAPLTLILTGVIARTAAKYGSRAARYVDMEAGHAAQNVCLQAVACGLGTTVVGAFDDAAVAQLLGCAGAEAPLILMPLGVPR